MEPDFELEALLRREWWAGVIWCALLFVCAAVIYADYDQRRRRTKARVDCVGCGRELRDGERCGLVHERCAPLPLIDEPAGLESQVPIVVPPPGGPRGKVVKRGRKVNSAPQVDTANGEV